MSGIDDLIKGVTGGQGGGLGGLLGGLAGASGGGGGLGDILEGLTGSDGQAGGSGGAGLPGGMGGLLSALLPVLGGMLAGGGLQKVLSGFQANGLSAQADSWVGTGANEPIGADDVRKVVGDDELTRIAGELGVSEDEAAAAVAQVLPTLVDKVSPDGQLPPESELDSAFKQLEGLDGKTS